MNEFETFNREISHLAGRRAAAMPETSFSGTELLLIDDDPDFLQVMAFALDGLWAETRIEMAKNGEEAMRKLEHMHPDLVITDLNMRAMNGLEVCRAVKRSRGLAHAKVLMITALRDPQIGELAFDEGVDEFMRKPFTPADLRRSAVRLLGLGLLPGSAGGIL